MKAYFLDTSVIIDYLRGEKATLKMLDNIEGDICSGYICLAELYEGVFRIKNPDASKKIIEDFFNSLSFIYGLDREIAQQFGKLRAQLKKQGNVIEDIDILIGAICLQNNLILITHNKKHFSHILGLQLY